MKSVQEELKTFVMFFRRYVLWVGPWQFTGVGGNVAEMNGVPGGMLNTLQHLKCNIDCSHFYSHCCAESDRVHLD